MPRIWAFLVFFLVATHALGQTGSEADRLFEEGRQLVREGKYDDACPKFVEAQRLRPGVGTLLNLGDCYERQGKTASASRIFEEALATAEAAKDARAKLARSRVESLQARLVKLTVIVPSDIDGLEITIDGEAFARERWGQTFAVDPGTYALEASAPGQQPWSQKVDALRGDVSVTVSFGSAPTTAKPTPAPSVDRKDERTSLSTQKIVAIGLASAGVVAMGVGAIFGSASKSAHDEADDHCKLGPTRDQCDQDGFDASERAISRGNVATVLFVLGGAAVAGGAVVWFTAPDPKETARTRRGVALTPVGLRGVW